MLQAQPVPSKIQLLNLLLQSLSAVIVDILAPATSNFTLPKIWISLFHTSILAPSFSTWYQYSHGTNTTTPGITAMNPSEMQFSCTRHSHTPTPWYQTPPFSASLTLQMAPDIPQHLANSTSHVRTAAQEFTRTEGAQKFIFTRLNIEVIDCCRIYHLPPPPSHSPPCLSKEIQRAAFAILWMGLRGEREGLPSMLATSFADSPGETQRGGFLPIFWDVPRANIHAVEDSAQPQWYEQPVSVPVIGYLLPKTLLFPEGSPLVQAWRPIRFCLPKPKLVSSREAARSTFLLCLKMNRWCSLSALSSPSNYSVGYLHSWHARCGSKFLSSLGHATLRLLCTCFSNLCPLRTPFGSSCIGSSRLERTPTVG